MERSETSWVLVHIPWTFYLISFIIISLIHLLIYYTFLYKGNSGIQNLSLYLCVGLLLLNFLYLLHSRVNLPYPIEFISAITIGISFLLFVAAIFYYLILSPLYLFGSEGKIQTFSSILKLVLPILCIFFILLSLYMGLFKKPVLKTLTLEIPNLTLPLRVIQISDLHISKLSSTKNLKYLINKVNSTEPDIIVLTGDIIDDTTSKILEKIRLLKLLKAKMGVFYVLGNHEYYHDTLNILNLIKDNNITVLNNTSTTLFNPDKKPLINIIGITDFAGVSLNFLAPELHSAILRRDPKAPSILLSHQPKVIHELTKNQTEEINLILSGHTHGGQIFPFNFLVLLQQPFIKGLHTLSNHSKIYISQGSGTWGPPMRLGTHSEITLFHLLPQENRPQNRGHRH